MDPRGAQRAHPGPRHRRGRSPPVPLSRRLAAQPRPREAREDARVRSSAPPRSGTHAGPPPHPPARERMRAAVARPKLDRERVLGGAARLLDLGFFRIGSEEYAETNQSYGLATMLREHVTCSKGVVTFDYIAKSGKHRIQSVADDELCRLVIALKRARTGGPELLGYQGPDGWVDIKSHDINAYLRDITGGEFTAKDFRTWHATVLCAVGLAVSDVVPASESARKRAVTRAVKEVSHYLGNTPTVCRASYIDPRVIDHYNDGVTIRADLDALGEGAAFGELATRGAIESSVLRLLQEPEATRRRLAKTRSLIADAA